MIVLEILCISNLIHFCLIHFLSVCLFLISYFSVMCYMLSKGYINEIKCHFFVASDRCEF